MKCCSSNNFEIVYIIIVHYDDIYTLLHYIFFRCDFAKQLAS